MALFSCTDPRNKLLFFPFRVGRVRVLGIYTNLLNSKRAYFYPGKAYFAQLNIQILTYYYVVIRKLAIWQHSFVFFRSNCNYLPSDYNKN